MRKCSIFACYGLFLFGIGTLLAAESTEQSIRYERDESLETLFAQGTFEAGVTGGALFSPFLADRDRPTINYSITEIQVGYMLTGIIGTNWYRGNIEILGEGFGCDIFQGPGNYIAGGTIWGRYNFVQPAWRLVPFLQGGMGATSTDIDQQYVGQAFQFNLEIGIGARYLINPRWSLLAEFRYQHISNADTGSHNIGINSIGPILGFSYGF
jgi:lipid A 3-O-deacylase